MSILDKDQKDKFLIDLERLKEVDEEIVSSVKDNFDAIIDFHQDLKNFFSVSWTGDIETERVMHRFKQVKEEYIPFLAKKVVNQTIARTIEPMDKDVDWKVQFDKIRKYYDKERPNFKRAEHYLKTDKDQSINVLFAER